MCENWVTATNIDHVSGTEFSTDVGLSNARAPSTHSIFQTQVSVCQINITIMIQIILTG